jgi:phosphate/sulfate permease
MPEPVAFCAVITQSITASAVYFVSGANDLAPSFATAVVVMRPQTDRTLSLTG